MASKLRRADPRKKFISSSTFKVLKTFCKIWIFNNLFAYLSAGGGILVELTKQATATKNYAALDEALQTRIPKFLYNEGQGKMMHVSEIVLDRNKRRPKHAQILKNEGDYDTYVPPDDKGQ